MKPELKVEKPKNIALRTQGNPTVLRASLAGPPLGGQMPPWEVRVGGLPAGQVPRVNYVCNE